MAKIILISSFGRTPAGDTISDVPMLTVRTTRLHIRPFETNDLDDAVRLHAECFGDADRESRQAWLDWTVRNYRALAELQQPPYGDYAVVRREDATLVGSVGLVPSYGPFGKLPVFRDRGRVEATDLFTPELGLFWSVRQAHRGQGYATEAARALINDLFEGLRAERVVATTEHDNAPSIEVMKRLGMTVEKNPDMEPAWFQTVGVLFNPAETAGG